MAPYKAAFLVPYGVDATLGGAGWTFSSSPTGLPAEILDAIADAFGMRVTADSPDLKVLEGVGIKATALFDEDARLQEIHFQLRGTVTAEDIGQVAATVIPGQFKMLGPRN